MKEIPLTKGFAALVDDEDYEWLSAHKWYASLCRHGRGAYAARTVKGRSVSMHRTLAGEPGLLVDHINGNPLDNRRANLRAVPKAVNQQNINTPVRSRTGERNIASRKGRFEVRFMRFGADCYVGRYETLEKAVLARDAFLDKEQVLALIRDVEKLQRYDVGPWPIGEEPAANGKYFRASDFLAVMARNVIPEAP